MSRRLQKYLRVHITCRKDTNHIFKEVREGETSPFLYGGYDWSKHVFLLWPLVLHQHKELPQSLLIPRISQWDILGEEEGRGGGENPMDMLCTGIQRYFVFGVPPGVVSFLLVLNWPITYKSVVIHKSISPTTPIKGLFVWLFVCLFTCLLKA